MISCIMPTRNRREWIPAAVDCFLWQTHTDSELIVLDSGEHAIEYLLPKSPRIRHIPDSPDHTLGVLCNHAAAAARGEWIAVWDDDDWYWPGRLDEQLQAIGSAKVCGYDRIYFERKGSNVRDRQLFEYHAPAGHLQTTAYLATTVTLSQPVEYRPATATPAARHPLVVPPQSSATHSSSSLRAHGERGQW